jgi:hypothetical protein
MIDLSVQFDDKKYKDTIAKCMVFGKDINKAINRAAKRAADSGKAETKRQMSSGYTLPSTEIGETIDTKTLNFGAEMRLASGVQDILAFKGVKPKTQMPPAKGRVLVEIKKGDTFEIDRGFVGVLSKKQKRIGLYQRDENKSNVFRRYHGPTTVGMFKANEAVHNAVLKKIMQTLDARIVHELERLLSV